MEELGTSKADGLGEVFGEKWLQSRLNDLEGVLKLLESTFGKLRALGEASAQATIRPECSQRVIWTVLVN